MLIIGIRVFAWGSALTAQQLHCGTCGSIAQFVQKTAMRFVTLFFILPVIPVSGKMRLIECQRCKTRYQAK
jgi:hypothetical protein